MQRHTNSQNKDVKKIKSFLQTKSLDPQQVNHYLQKAGSTLIEEKQKALKLLLRPDIDLYSMMQEIPELKEISEEHFNEWKKTEEFATNALIHDTKVTGVHAFYHENIFEAVYCTNLLMRSCDVLVTKPSELAFYPVPKLFIKRVGGHEQWGAIHSAEIGDGTMECRDIAHTLQMLQLFLKDKGILIEMCESIKVNKTAGIYDGAYKVVELAFQLKK